MIIKCPNCGRRFDLQRRPPTTFCCPKCGFRAPFGQILSAASAANEPVNPPVVTIASPETPDTNPGAATTSDVTVTAGQTTMEKTRVVNLAGDSYTKTQQPAPKRMPQGTLTVTFKGRQLGIIKLPHSAQFYNLGRNSSDGTAQVKITPDISMSRIHAGVRTVAINGQMVYQISSAKSENPVYVNGAAVPKGKAYNLKNGDTIVMGETTMVFKIV